MAAQALPSPADAEPSQALRALAGFGGRRLPRARLFVARRERRERERGRTGTAWTLGYVVGVAFVALLHVALPGGWRAEEAAYSAAWWRRSVRARCWSPSRRAGSSPWATARRAGRAGRPRGAAGPDAELRFARAALDESAPPDAECIDALAASRRRRRALVARPPVQPGELLATQLVAPPFSADGDDGDGGADGLRATTLSWPAAAAQRRLLRAVRRLAERRARPQLCAARPPTCPRRRRRLAADAPGAKAATVGSPFPAGASITALALLKGGVVGVAAAPRRDGGVHGGCARRQDGGVRSLPRDPLLTAELYPTDSAPPASASAAPSAGGAAAAAPLVRCCRCPCPRRRRLALAGSATAATLQQEGS